MLTFSFWFIKYRIVILFVHTTFNLDFRIILYTVNPTYEEIIRFHYRTTRKPRPHFSDPVFVKSVLKRVRTAAFKNLVKKISTYVIQIIYLLNNWIYSTNHKRISINYFWFVLLSGVVGMVLATIIRTEMAYPGIGVLAGDNSQYLSTVAAHGVIMVFFMAMPLLFGFFTNFLLPTQLGVHDVAFPRMNSAAFWFLPASLIVLAQLVCVDRRYQRMNCFNVRELQSLVRKRFFFELLNDNSFNETLTSTIVNVKFKRHDEFTNNSNSIMFNYYNLYLKSLKTVPTSQFDLWLNNKNKITFTNIHYNFNFFTIIKDSIYFLINFLINLVSTNKNMFKYYFNSVINDFSYYIIESFDFSWSTESEYLFDKKISQLKVTQVFNSYKLMYNHINTTTIESYTKNRYTQTNQPSFLFKIKIGNYLPEKPLLKNFDHLINTLNAKTGQNKKAIWFNSDYINDFLINKNSEFLILFQNTNKNELQLKLNTYLFSHFDIFFFINNFLLKTDFINLINTRWSFTNNMSTQFNKLFFSQNKQILTFNNWKNLKLSREGWRCRLLLARNQNSLYKRYINESDLLWIVEKNAKDLIPGWTLIAPFSSRLKYTIIGKTDIGLWVVVFTLFASIVSCSNFIITYRYLSTLNNRKMRDARSFFSETILATCWMSILANPMLILGLLMLLSDRHWKTSFFDYSGGGDTVLFQHMFWFFGHPEVYIIIVPCFGFVNTILSFYLRKRISARASLMYSVYTIAFLGFFVWGHHMYMVGLAHTTRMLYSTLTVMISVPAATKIMHWLVTFVNSSLHFELPLIFVLSFIFFFLSGGISGMSVAHTGMDVLFHDTFFVVGHFHVMLAGSLMFAGFAGIYFYLPAIFGVRYNRFFAYLHYIYYTVGQLFTVIPMMWLGYAGMPRRVLDYPAAMGGWHSLSTSAHMLSIAGILCFIFMLFDSLRKKKPYIIKTFGIGRYNTRLNFYLYEIHRNKYWLHKSLHLVRNPLYKTKSYGYNKIINYELYESTLFYYLWK